MNNPMRQVLSDAEKANMKSIEDKGLELHALIKGLEPGHLASP